MESNLNRTGDPAAAFEDLRAEVSVLRRAVEGLPLAWQENRPPDYSTDLGKLYKGLQDVAVQLQAVQEHPAVRMTPEEHSRALELAGQAMMRDVAKRIQQSGQGIEREREQLASLVRSAHTRRAQRQLLFMAMASALVLGLVVSPFLIRQLPVAAAHQVAAFIVGGGD